MSRLWGTIKSRLTEPPLPLKAHALAMLALPVVVAGPESGYRWFGVTVVVIVVWPLLRGSLYGWWIQAATIGITAMGLVGSLRLVSDEHPALSVFVSPATVAWALVLLTIAATTLLDPRTRAFCRDSRGMPRTRLGLALTALFVGSIPAMALSLEPRLPPRRHLDVTPNLAFAGSDPTGPSALMVGGHRRGPCLLVLESAGTSSSCGGHEHQGQPPSVRTEHLHAWLLSRQAVRVTVVYGNRPPRDARLLSRASRANVFVVTEGLDDIRGVEAYDASGRTIVDCRYCELPFEVDP